MFFKLRQFEIPSNIVSQIYITISPSMSVDPFFLPSICPKTSQFTVHLNGKNLSTNSSWDFDGVVDTMDPYWFVPDKYFFPRSYLSRWCCDSLQELFKKVVKIKSRQHFQAKKTSATPKFCKRNFSRMLRFGNMNILSTPAPIFRVPKILVRYVWGEKFPSGKNK